MVSARPVRTALHAVRNRDRRGVLLDRYEGWSDGPLMILALAVIPLLLVPAVVELNDDAALSFDFADWQIWGCFARRSA